MHELEWAIFNKAYSNYVSLLYTQSCPAAVSDFLEFVGIPWGYAHTKKHSDNYVMVPEGSVRRIKALASPHYVALYKAMKINE